MPGPRPPSSSSGRGRGQGQSHRLAQERGAATPKVPPATLGRGRRARLPMGEAPGTRPTGSAQDRPSSRAAHGEPCPRRRQRGRTGTPGAARPGHPAPSTAAPQPRTAEPARPRCSPTRKNRRPRPWPRSGRPNSAHRTAPRRDLLQPSAPDPSPLTGVIPARFHRPSAAHRRSPHARCSLTRLHSPSLPLPGAPPRSPSLPVPSAPAPLTTAPRARCLGPTHRPSPPGAPAPLTVALCRPPAPARTKGEQRPSRRPALPRPRPRAAPLLLDALHAHQPPSPPGPAPVGRVYPLPIGGGAAAPPLGRR